MKQKTFAAERGGAPLEVIFEIEDEEDEPTEEGNGTIGETAESAAEQSDPTSKMVDPTGEEAGVLL